jgi:transcriptional regulator NrdR family protein
MSAVARHREVPADECRECGGDSKVIRVRRPRHKPISRRRECQSCGHRWNTTEHVCDAGRLRLVRTR